MAQLLLLFITTLLLFSCNKEEEETTTTKTVAELRVDSLTALADSLAQMRNRGASFNNMHLHSGKDLAAQAHQDPKKKRAMLKRRAKTYESRKKSREAASRAIQKKLEELKTKEEDLF